jgi:hypothetical protein
VLPVDTFKPLFRFAAAPLTVKPLANVPNPEFETVNKPVAPLFNVNEVPPVLTDADTDPVAILKVLTFSPTIAEAGMLNNPAPEPEKYCALDVIADKLPEIPTDPVNKAGPMFINVFDPVTVKVPIMVTLPENTEEPVLLTPELPVMVPGGPAGPAAPLGPSGPGDVICTTLVFTFVVTILLIVLLL